MESFPNYQDIVDQCNEECRKCFQDFQDEGIPFSQDMCKVCPTGFKLHKALCNISKTEREWGKINWGSFAWKDFYKG